MEKSDKKRTIRNAFCATLPVFAGYIVLGFGFGVILKTKGYGLPWAIGMSVLIYAGTMQYVAADLLAGGVSLVSAAITTLLVQARHLFYGISLAERYRGAGRLKPYMMFALTDETYSLAVRGAPEGEKNPHLYYFFVSLFDQCYWIMGGALGSIAGTLLHFNSEGVDFVLTALFVTVFLEQWLSTKHHLPALIGLAASAAALLLFGSKNFLIPAMIGITVLLLLSRRLPQKEKKEAER